MPFATDLPSRVVLRRERNVFNASVRDLADGSGRGSSSSSSKGLKGAAAVLKVSSSSSKGLKGTAAVCGWVWSAVLCGWVWSVSVMGVVGFLCGSGWPVGFGREGRR